MRESVEIVIAYNVGQLCEVSMTIAKLICLTLKVLVNHPLVLLAISGFTGITEVE
jgi:hypothetical protein